VATSLGLSIRQLRRNETQALQTLAEVVWTRYDLANRYGAPQSAMAEQSLITGAETEEEEDILPEVPAPLADEQELAWLSQSLPCQPGTVQELVCGTLKTAEPLLQALAVRLTSHLPDQLPRVAIQATSMRQALLILLTEAGRFASCGEIVLNATVEPGHVVLTVRATGTLAKTIYAGPDNLSDRLEVAKQLVTLSGGVLETTGICDAPGFTARLFLPTVTQLTVLFIDDNTDTLQLYQRYLAGTPYHALGARDPVEALTLAETAAPRIIVLDIMLPGVDGWELLGRLRNHPRTQDVPVIVCSILPMEELALSLGAAAFLQKRVSREALLCALQEQVDGLAKGSR